ncbi:MAG: GH92 family glycosyl hydrolase [Micrococcales bacterium]|nr:GH92 family glycosyl hydrolase [Micrococcales bacterium]
MGTTRRTIGSFAALSLALSIAVGLEGPAVADPPEAPTNPAALVNTFIGSQGQGNTYPGATAPFGMVQMTPTTAWFSGYQYTDTRIYGFGTQAISGAGCWEQGGVLPMLPVTGTIGAGTSNTFNISSNATFNYRNYGSLYTHTGEVGEAGYYKTRLTDRGGIDVETTATTRVGVQRYTFPATADAHVLFNSGYANGWAASNTAQRMKILSSFIEYGADGLVTGGVQAQGFCSGQGYTYWQYWAAKVSAPVTGYGTWDATGGVIGRASVTKTAEAQQGLWLSFDASVNQVLQISTGISYTSVEGAKRNLSAEGLDAGGNLVPFNTIRAATQAQWNDYLLRVKAYGGTTEDQVTFYTALYHGLINPAVSTDVDGKYFGFDKQVHTAVGWEYYQYFSLWDTYRTQNQLIAAFWPERARDLGRSILAIYAQGGWLPRWAYASYETNCMTGDPVTAYLADLWRYGAMDTTGGVVLPGSDTRSGQPVALNLETAYTALYQNLNEVPAALPFQFSGRSGNATYIANGYIAHVSNQATKGQSEDRRRGGSATYEYAQSDCAFALMADALGKPADARQHVVRAGNWRNVWDPAVSNAGFTGFPRSKNASGAWTPATFNATATGSDSNGMEEGTPWQYQFLTWQDYPGFVKQVGGMNQALSRLDTFFEMPLLLNGTDAWKNHARTRWVSGALNYSGAKYNPNNEPDLQAPWYYSYLSQPARTSAIARAAQKLFANGPTGVTGNDDLGTMSAWYALTVMGLFPGIPGSGDLMLTAPMMEKFEVSLPGGRTLVIEAPGADGDELQYIASATWNGQPFDFNYINVDQMLAGGTLSLTLTTSATSTWGTRAASAPMSLCASTDYFQATDPVVAMGTPITGVFGKLSGPIARSATTLTALITWDEGGTSAVTVGNGTLGRDVTLVNPIMPPEPGITITGTITFNDGAADVGTYPVSYTVSGEAQWATAGDFAALAAAIRVHELFENQEDRYTPASFAPFAAAMAYARSLVGVEPLRLSRITAAIDGLNTTSAGLEEVGDPTPLIILIGQAKDKLNNPGLYVAANLAALAAAVGVAEAFLETTGYTQDEVTAQMMLLVQAIAAVAPKADLTLLNALVSVVETLVETQYTPASWARVMAATAAARAVAAAPDPSVDEASDAFAALDDALQGLALRAAKQGLKSAIDVAASIQADAALYVPASIAGLASLLEAAQAVYDNHDATRSEVTAAQSDLIVAIAAARLRAVPSVGLLTPSAAAHAALAPAGVAAAVEAAQAAVSAKVASARLAKVKIVGVKKVGKKLVARTGKVGSDVKLSYQWLRSGKPIAKATKAVYQLRAADKGKRISVKVSAKVGKAKAVKTSPKTKPIR